MFDVAGLGTLPCFFLFPFLCFPFCCLPPIGASIAWSGVGRLALYDSTPFLFFVLLIFLSFLSDSLMLVHTDPTVA